MKPPKKANIFADDRITQTSRIVRNEKYVMLPIKILVLIGSGIYVYFEEKTFGANPTYRYLLGLYTLSNLLFFFLLLQLSHIKYNLLAVRISSYFLSVIDNLYLCYLINLTGGIESKLFWLYCGLMIRNCVNFPSVIEQTILNVVFVCFYIGIIYLHQDNFSFVQREFFWMRITVLLLVSFCSWGILNAMRKIRAEYLATQEMQVRQEKFSSQVKLASEVAHELKNPLGVINNAVYVTHAKLHKFIDDPFVFDQLKIIEQEVLRSDRIITDLLGYARMRDGTVIETNVHQIFDDTVGMFLTSDKNPGSGVEFEKRYDSQLPSLFIDPGQLQQVFINIISNSIEAMKGRAPRIKITTRFNASEKQILITIADNGRGIKSEDLDKVFNSFFSTSENGSGLGLSIVKNIIETYNGEISIESTDGVGTTTRICFPLVILATAAGDR